MIRCPDQPRNMQEPSELLDPSLRKATADLIRTYQGQNGPAQEFVDSASQAEFARHIRINRPFCVRGGCAGWPAVRKWSAGYLQARMGDQLVKVAQTPYGYVEVQHKREA